MSLLDDFTRVSGCAPCPICGKPDWCLVSRDSRTAPSSVICSRIESNKQFGEAGWLHRLRQREAWDPVRTRTRRVGMAGGEPNMGALASRLQAAVVPAELQALAQGLGVSAASLRRFGIGHTGTAWSFPMHDDQGVVRGIRLRSTEGRKWAIKGSRNGLFLPSGLTGGEMLMVCEGPTDTAALIDLKLSAIGRPSCRGGKKLVARFVRSVCPEEVVVVADADSPGIRGAQELAAALSLVCRRVRVLVPPGGVRDAREWKRAGATNARVVAAAKASPILRLSIRRRGSVTS